MSKDIAKSPTRPAWAAELTAKQMLFVQAYASTLNATKAALHAGYAKSGARVRGHDLRRKKHVQEAIAKLLEERMGVTRTRVIEEISRLAFSNIGDVLSVEDGKPCREGTLGLGPGHVVHDRKRGRAHH